MIKQAHAQSVLEYTLLMSIIVTVVILFFPMVKRGQQSLIKVVADQVGNQVNAEQDFSLERSHLVNSFSLVNGLVADVYNQQGHIDAAGEAHFFLRHQYDQTTATRTQEYTNQGFLEK